MWVLGVVGIAACGPRGGTSADALADAAPDRTDTRGMDLSTAELDPEDTLVAELPLSDLPTADLDLTPDPDAGIDTTDLVEIVEPQALTREDALLALRAAVIELDADWRFAPDPDAVGIAEGWQLEGFDDAAWDTIDAGATWEEQGYPDHDGFGWYRRRVDVPEDWAGSRIKLSASGVDDEYDVYVNGAHVRHYGEFPERSVWNWRTHTDLSEHLVAGQENLLVIRVNDWGSGGGIWRAIQLRRSVPIAPYAHLLPAPVIDEHPEWVALADAAWQMAFDKVSFGTAANGLSEAFMDEGFNEQIYQWDSCFICMFARYGHRLFPVMATLDNFYGKQRPDGYIQRVYSETDGGEIGEPTVDEPMINPPLFAWVEWEYRRVTGDGSRLAAVLPTLEGYFNWLEDNVRAWDGSGLYYQTDLGSGMDNTPRGEDIHGAGWADMTAQQALAAQHLGRMAEVLDMPQNQAGWEAKVIELQGLVDGLLWDPNDGFFYDRKASGGLSGVRHIGGYWVLLAGLASDEQAAVQAGHLTDPAEFGRLHPFPALSAAHPLFDPEGHYWRGGVWAPTNYMTLKALGRYGLHAEARAAAEAHLTAMAAVFADPQADADDIAPEEQDGDYQTIWECYAPDALRPATRWDQTYLSRQDFVGWSGLGPIAVLIEDIIGLEIDAVESTVRWRLTRTDRHGVEGFTVALGHQASVVAAPRPSPSSPVTITVETTAPFSLEILRPGVAAVTVEVTPEDQSLQIDSEEP